MLYTSNQFATTTTALPYAEIIKSYAFNAAGQAITNDTLTTLQLNSTPLRSSIDGLSVSSNQITLPSGTYSISAQTVVASATNQTIYSSIYLWDATNSTVISSGADGSSVWNAGVSQTPYISTQLTLSTSTLVEVRVIVQVPSSADGFVARDGTATIGDSTADLDHRTKVKIWKLA